MSVDIYPEYHRWQEILTEFVEAIQDELNPIRLEALLRQHNLSTRVASEIRRDPVLKAEIVQLLESKIEEAEAGYEEYWLEYYENNIQRLLGEGELDLASRTQLGLHPNIIRALETRFSFRPTGDLNTFLQNYRRTYFTPQCPQYLGTITCINGAAKYGNIEMIQRLLPDMKADFIIANLLVTAAEHGQIEVVKFLLPNPNIKDLNFAIGVAARHNHFDIVELLLDNPKVVSLGDVVRPAVKFGRADLIERIIDDPRVSARSVQVALEASIEHDNDEIFYLVLNNPKIRNFDDAVEMTIAKNDLIKLEALLAVGSKIGNLDYLLVRAVEKGNLDAVKLILNDPRVQNIEPSTMEAIHTIRPDIMGVLLADSRMGNPWEFLRMAIIANNFEMVKLILTSPKHVDLGDAINKAISYERYDILKLLLTDSRISDLNSALELAVSWTRPEMVKLLLQDPRVTDISRAVNLAERTRKHTILQMLANFKRELTDD